MPVTATPTDWRKSLLAKIHIAKADLGLTDDRYRAILTGVAGVESAKDADLPGLNDVLQAMHNLGWQPKPKGKAKGKKLSPATKNKPIKNQVDKLRALWIELGKQGAVKNPYEDGLQAFVKRMTGVERVEWLKPRQVSKCVEGLKAIAKRKGVTLQ